MYADVNSNDIPWHDLHGNLTLGKLRNYFETCLQSKHLRHLRTKLSHFENYNDDLYQKIISALVPHRNKDWGHSRAGFARKEDCDLYIKKYLPLLKGLFLATQENFPHILIIKTATEIVCLPSSGKDSIPIEPGNTGTFLYLKREQAITYTYDLEKLFKM